MTDDDGPGTETDGGRTRTEDEDAETGTGDESEAARSNSGAEGEVIGAEPDDDSDETATNPDETPASDSSRASSQDRETSTGAETSADADTEHDPDVGTASDSDVDTESGSDAGRPDDERPPAGPSDDHATGDGDPAAGDGDTSSGQDGPTPGVPDPDAVDPEDEVPPDVRKYARFKKMDGAQYDRVNEFLRDRTYVTAREWAIARLCADFRTETGVEMTKIGENLPELVPFMTDTYTPQAVNQARSSFEEKVRKAGATFLYGAMCDFFTAEELDDVMYEATEVAKFLLEVEGVDLSVEEELEAEERISAVMREVREASEELRDEDANDE